MRARLVSLMVLLVGTATLMLGLPASARMATWPVPTSLDQQSSTLATTSLSPNDFETRVMVTINQARVANGRRPVALFDSCTDRLAERWGARISRTGLFAHRDQAQVIRRCHHSWAGEALIRGAGLTPESMVDAWLKSPPHRAILLNRRAKRAGVAVVADDQGRLIGVLNLVRPH